MHVNTFDTSANEDGFPFISLFPLKVSSSYYRLADYLNHLLLDGTYCIMQQVCILFWKLKS